MKIQYYVPGTKIGKWTILTRFYKQCKTQAHTYYTCKCECGYTKDVAGYHLKNGTSSSCITCSSIDRNLRHGNCRTKNRSGAYTSWLSMKQRCTNPNDPSYRFHGARGITIDSRWNKFENFLEDMGDRPKGLSIDRINTYGNYEPGNCRWADQVTQTNNTRANVHWEYEGTSRTIAQWATYLGIGYQTLRRRVQIHNWTIKLAIETPVKQYKFKNK